MFIFAMLARTLLVLVLVKHPPCLWTSTRLAAVAARVLGPCCKCVLHDLREKFIQKFTLLVYAMPEYLRPLV